MKTRQVDAESESRVVSVLRPNPVFRSLDDEQLRQAAGQAILLQLDPGEVLINRGDPPAGFHLVLAGELRVQMATGDNAPMVEVARFGAGHAVGIADLLLEQKATSTVDAAIASTIIRFEPRFFQVMVERMPAFGLELARVMAGRLALAVERIPLPDADPGDGPTDELIALLPREFMERHRLMPLKLEGEVLTVGCVDSPTPEVMQRLRTYLPAMELRAVRLQSGQLEATLRTHVGAPPPPESVGKADSTLLESLLRAMVKEGASDLHLSAGHRPRWRIDGDLHEIADWPFLESDSVLELLGPRLPDRNRDEFAQVNDTDFGLTVEGLARFRVNLFRDAGGIGAVLRQIPMAIIDLEQLGMPSVVGTFCDYPNGLVLVTGPTGSGKSTTLASMVDRINRSRPAHIVTLEDPVEFVHASQRCLVNQREVGSHTESFSRALRAALREDPDVVLVGEMRDLETVSLALETANTGHLVLGTLHTVNAITTVDRIVGLFPSEQQARIRVTLADVLRAVVSQSLLRRIGGGRVAAVEVLVSNHAVANLIRESKTHQIASIMQTGKAAGNQQLNDALDKLVKQGKIEAEDAMSASVERKDLARRLGLAH